MYYIFDDIVEDYDLPKKIFELISLDKVVFLQKLSNDCTKINSSEYSLYFQNTKLVMITKDDEKRKKVFTSIHDM